eukprot:TRINITY_DN1279_c0_g1_i8.p1 TRINITY_DN1279_c0_g1~~TRINITY_DN1279_c0_g1_i8.p1  ORF type:complete len:256 (-),score=42.73 TRINITY_DN1279_c0_g1_i8:664-1431(-)
MSEPVSQFQDNTVEQTVTKPKKTLLGRLGKGIKKSVRRLSHRRADSKHSVEDSAQEVEVENLSVTDQSEPLRTPSIQLQTTEEEQEQTEVPVGESFGLQPSNSLIVNTFPDSPIATQSKSLPIQEEASHDTPQNTDDNSADINHVLNQIRAIVTIQRFVRRWLQQKRSAKAVEETLRKAVQEMGVGSEEQITQAVVEEKSESLHEEDIQRGRSVQEKQQLQQMEQERGFFMLKMGIATLVIAIILRFGVLPLLDI